MRSLSILQLVPTKLALNNRVAKSERLPEEYSALLYQRLADSKRVPEEYSVFYGHKPALDPAVSCAAEIDLFIGSAN